MQLKPIKIRCVKSLNIIKANRTSNINVTKLCGNLKPESIIALDYSKRGQGRRAGWRQRSRGGWQGKREKLHDS